MFRAFEFFRIVLDFLIENKDFIKKMMKIMNSHTISMILM